MCSIQVRIQSIYVYDLECRVHPPDPNNRFNMSVFEWLHMIQSSSSCIVIVFSMVSFLIPLVDDALKELRSPHGTRY